MTNETVFDPVRKKHVKATPEEIVRQALIKWLNEKAGVPISHMACEYFLKANGKRMRADIVVFGKSLEPLLIVECKSPKVNPDKRTAEQVAYYNSRLKVKYLVMSNGLKTVFFRFDETTDRYLETDTIPHYTNM